MATTAAPAPAPAPTRTRTVRSSSGRAPSRPRRLTVTTTAIRGLLRRGSRPAPPPGRKRVSFSGSPDVNTVHVYDRDAPTGGGGDRGDQRPALTVEEPVRESTLPVSILKPSDGRPASPDAPCATSAASAAAAAAAAAAGAAWAAGEVAEESAADGRVRWLGDGDSVPIVSAEQEEPLPPAPAQPERPDLSKVSR